MKKITDYFNSAKHFIVTLRFSILSIFTTLFVLTVVLMGTINYFSTSETLYYMANQLMREVSVSLYHKFNQEINKVIQNNQNTVQLISRGTLNQNEYLKMMWYVFNLVKPSHIVQGAYWAQTNGSFVIAEHQPNQTIMTAIIDRNATPPSQTIIYRHPEGNIIKETRSHQVTYDPRKRPWYIKAKKQKQTIWTDIYPFLPKDDLGISMISPVYHQNILSTNKKNTQQSRANDQTGQLMGVLGMDIKLDWLSDYLSHQKISENAVIFIVTEDGKLIAYSHPQEAGRPFELLPITAVKAPWVPQSFHLYQKKQQQQFHFINHGEKYLAAYRVLPHLGVQKWFMGIVLPMDDFVGEAKKIALMNIGISFILLILGILFILKLVTLLVKPIKQLVQETQKIKHLHLEGESNILSHIKEIIYLADAFDGMKKGLRSFCSYLPTTLVRKLIETGQNAHLGGMKKNIVVLFSDIQNFTPITHKMEVDALMKQLCHYFDELTHIIIQEKGTIDKYIGDSIMAFWGAPTPVDYPCHHAARAALACIERLNLLNEVWIQEGKDPFYTRIGIHMGEAIVGNVGSSERLNYTAVGETINIASRLEGANKKYGTHIIVSHAVYEALKQDFVFKFLGHTSLKGLSKREKLYELKKQK